MQLITVLQLTHCAFLIPVVLNLSRHLSQSLNKRLSYSNSEPVKRAGASKQLERNESPALASVSTCMGLQVHNHRYYTLDRKHARALH
jgi:hypothetical protein